MRWRVTYRNVIGAEIELDFCAQTAFEARILMRQWLRDRFGIEHTKWHVRSAVGIPDAVPSTGAEP